LYSLFRRLSLSSFKVLFHKNKEIKRMLSNKLTVSLMSLITILALVFIAPAVMAAFNATLSEHGDRPDIGAAPGLQVERPSDNNLKVKVMFAENVTGADVKANTAVGGFDMKGAYIPEVLLKDVTPNAATDVKREFTVEITITAETAKVTLQIKKDIAAANAFSTNKSAALLEDIYLYGSEVDITPRVYGIRRADNSGLPLTSGAANVIITLSEMPQAFTAAEIDVMNGTAGTPIALGPIRQNAVGLSQFATHIDKPEIKELTVMQIRDGILKTATPAEDGNARDEYDFKGINYYLSTVATAGHSTAFNEDNGAVQQTTDIPDDLVGAVSKLKAEIGAADNAVSYFHEDNDGNVVDADGDANGIQGVQIQHGDTAAQPGANVTAMPLKDGDKLSGTVRPPTKKGTANIASDTSVEGVTVVEVTILAANFDRSKKEKDYARPALADFEDVATYGFALARWGALTSVTADGQRSAYEKEKKIYDAYIALQDLIKEARMEAITDRREELIDAATTGTTTQIAENVLPPTGRDGMLHPYSVAITPSYTMDETVVTVNRWQNAASDPGVYKPPVLETDYTEGFDKLTIGVTPAAAAAAAVQPSGVIVFTVPSAVFK
jgi:hypothetical protein